MKYTDYALDYLGTRFFVQNDKCPSATHFSISSANNGYRGDNSIMVIMGLMKYTDYALDYLGTRLFVQNEKCPSATHFSISSANNE